MHLRILLPFEIFAEVTGVTRIVAETHDGSFGLLPNRLDCVAALAPGILTWQTPADGEGFAAVDVGTLTKVGREVVVTVRRALQGRDLASLRTTVDQEFLALDQTEHQVRTVMAKLETGFARRFMQMQS
ncbi:F0F1 ATP synthase subunit epsilon [Rhodospira trueperi]|uniref:F-type H+-transporting ATPase subunit epsilon n=1 Tax=Rhodospira trueperi TaxID=69960 RepID=A0A1G7I6Y1_9PROT|nr:F0F1 ATP synthase subunit epsilon [Rhodospira trueperi]SDF08445.1 F-type H+-transporting ATPase subunit epsilon [Rhodospira trueperi]